MSHARWKGSAGATMRPSAKYSAMSASLTFLPPRVKTPKAKRLVPTSTTLPAGEIARDRLADLHARLQALIVLRERLIAIYEAGSPDLPSFRGRRGRLI